MASFPAVEFRLLGPFEVAVGGRALAMGSRQQRLLLAALVLRLNRPFPTDQLIDILWGDTPPASAETTLRVLVSRLRRTLVKVPVLGVRPPLIVCRGAGYCLEADAATVDANRFFALVTEAAERARAGAHRQAARGLAEALALWRGPALADLASIDFARVEAARLDEARLGAAEALADSGLAAGDPSAALSVLEPLVSAHPLREGLWGRLMLALYRQGRQAEALRAYQRVRRLLADELGLQPGLELRRLESQILAHDPVLEMRSAAAVELPPTNLGETRTPFLGRVRELDEVALLLDSTRLLTITGIGGGGKTSLARQIARLRLPQYPDGVWFVDLATVRHPATVPDAVTSALRLLAAAPGDMDPVRRLREWLAARRLLLVLDNCEHVIDSVATLLEEIMPGAPGISVLATSREILAVPGEATWSIPPLSLPQREAVRAADLVGSDAVELFCARAHRAQPSFALTDANAAAVARICRQLDGIPLAIELAAARVRVLSAQQLADRLADRFAILAATSRGATTRHQTLKAAIDWSWNLLPEPEQKAFRRLAVFPAGFTLDAAEIVVAGGQEPAPGFAGLDVVARLVDKSLVVANDCGDEVRYSLLETVRAYAAEQLAHAGEVELAQEAHCTWLLNEADGFAAVGYVNTDQDVGRIEAQEASFRSALEWCLANDRRTDALRLLAVHWLYALWSDRSDLGLLFARCLADPRPEPSSALAECLAAAFQIRAYQPEASPDAAVATIREAVAMADVLGDPSSQARFYLGNALYSLGQFDEARALLLAAREQWVAANLEFGVAWCDHELAWEAILRGAHMEARARLEHALLDVYGDREAPRDPLITAHLEATLAEAAARSGDHQLAERMAARAVATARGLHGRGPLVMALTRASDVAILGGDLVTASTALTELLQLLSAIGARRWVASALDAAVALLTVDDTESGARAARLLGAAEALRVLLGEAPPTVGPVSDLIEARRAAAVDCLGEPRFDVEIARGRRATADEALRWALGMHRTPPGWERQNYTIAESRR